ncbi:MAG: PKD domain-containing protein, partial [Planctomycetota bacterium]
MHSPTGSLFHSRLGRAIGVAATMSVASTAWSQDWLDTAAGNSLKEDDRLFSVVEIDGEDAIRTTSTATNIHSHFRTPFQTTSFRGEFRVDNSRGGVGITFHSDYPNSDTYYRLRRFKRKDFHISNHGTSTSGDGSSGVVPRAKVWYAFAVSVENGSSETRIRAKIWEAKGSEPDSWQIDVRDDSETRLVSGKVGLWSMGSGRKYWRRLQVNGRPLGESIVEPNLEPSVRIVEVLEQGSVGSETTLAFRGEASDPDSSLGSGDCVWDFGDGESLKGAEVEHSFTSPGDYEVTVRVDDGAGGVASDRVTVTIEEPVVPEEAPTLGAHGWIDTRAKNSLSVDDRLFTVDEIDSASVLRTQSNGTNIHSHYALPNNGVAAGLFSGRMMGNHSDAGFGVTFLSDYPNADRYYRLRSHGDDEFHISPHG